MSGNALDLFGLSYVVLWGIVIAQVALILALARLVGQLSRRLPPAGARVVDPGPQIGSRLPSFTGKDLLERPLSIEFPRSRGVFLMSISPNCSICASLLPAAKKFFEEISKQAEGIWVIVGSEESQDRYARANKLHESPILSESALPMAWRVGGAPFGVWISPSGEVQSKGMVNDREQLESLWNAVKSGYPSFDAFMNEQLAKLQAQSLRGGTGNGTSEEVKA